MKVEIDLNDILGDEDGVETLQESVRRQVVAVLAETTKKAVQHQINVETNKVINEELRKVLTERMPSLIDDLMNAEYIPVDRYGTQGKATSFRAELIKSITEDMVYRKQTHSSEKNAFTKAVDSTIAEKIAEFKSVYLRQVDAQFVAEAMNHAAEKLAERLGIKK